LRAADVGHVYLLHGTFVGDDTWGLYRPIGRYFPRLGAFLRRTHKKVVDGFVGEHGNFLTGFVKDLGGALNAEGGTPIPVERFVWSSGNHHLARADAAVRLIDELLQLDLPEGKRILCWGHSHGGNVLALVTNLLSGHQEDVTAFFAAARSHYRGPWSGRLNIPAWGRVERRLTDTTRPVLQAPLDIVTFGTPIRYGWNLDGCAKLLHFVSHRPVDGLPEHQTVPPRNFGEFALGTCGDFMQQIGIAGTDFSPFVPFTRSWRADRNLGRLLQPEYSLLDLWQRLCIGQRVADAGQTLLVDYHESPTFSFRSFTGHMMYTCREWLPFHAAETARRLYTVEA
jgi:hypothetical protein